MSQTAEIKFVGTCTDCGSVTRSAEEFTACGTCGKPVMAEAVGAAAVNEFLDLHESLKTVSEEGDSQICGNRK